MKYNKYPINNKRHFIYPVSLITFSFLFITTYRINDNIIITIGIVDNRI